MRFPRSSGILLHPTSLPGPYGIGDLGAAARSFADFLADSGQTLWQVLPLGPTGFGDSPYQCFSTVAGNPLLIALDEFDVPAPSLPEDSVEFERLIPWKMGVLEEIARRFFAGPADPAYTAFCAANASWLEDFALFMALKQYHGEVVWSRWEAGARERDPQALAGWRERLAPVLAAHRYYQFLFFRQWRELRDYCAARQHPDHGRSTHLRRPRQRRRLGQPRVLRARRQWRPYSGRRRAA